MISIENKSSILSFFYDHITVDKKERVLPRADMKKEEFVEQYTSAIVENSNEDKTENFALLRELIFIDQQIPPYYLDNRPEEIDEERYERITQMILDNKESYNGYLVNFVDFLMSPITISITSFFEGKRYHYIERILSIWQVDEINEVISYIKEELLTEINNEYFCQSYITIMYALESILDGVPLSEKLKEINSHVNKIMLSQTHYDWF